MIVDCHTHWTQRFLSDERLEPSGWLDYMQRHGVTHSIVLPSVGLRDHRKICQENDEIAAVCAASGGRMIPFCTVNLWTGPEAVAEFRRCLGELNHRGLKIHPWLQGVSPSSGTMDALCELAAEHEVPILFHDGTPCFSLPSQMALLAKRHPSVTIILGHSGLFEHWREAIAAMSYAESLWGCLCGPHPAALRQLVKLCDRTRLVWGSDFGWGSGLGDPIGYRLELFDLLDLSDHDRESILCDNAARLFSLKSAKTNHEHELGATPG